MIDLDPDQRAMLNEALKKARHLVTELEKQKAEIDASPPSIEPDKLEMGRRAMIKAIASAKRSLAALEDAERMTRAPDDQAPEDHHE